jgi:hypothetical protein
LISSNENASVHEEVMTTDTSGYSRRLTTKRSNSVCSRQYSGACLRLSTPSKSRNSNIAFLPYSNGSGDAQRPSAGVSYGFHPMAKELKVFGETASHSKHPT